jgi:AcrR family transcriptional regulator
MGYSGAELRIAQTGLYTHEMSEVRDRLLNAAERLVYRHGVHGVGIDAILAEAKVAKMSLYKHFRSKEALVAAMLERRHDAWMAWFRQRIDKLGRRAGGAVPAMFDALAEWFRRPDFHGCAFVNCAAEFPDPRHPIRRIAGRHKKALKDAVAAACRASRVDVSLAPALYLLVEGAITAALVEGSAAPAQAGKRAALRLLAVP